MSKFVCDDNTATQRNRQVWITRLIPFYYFNILILILLVYSSPFGPILSLASYICINAGYCGISEENGNVKSNRMHFGMKSCSKSREAQERIAVIFILLRMLCIM